MTAVRVVIKLPYVLYLPLSEYLIGEKDAVLVATIASDGQGRLDVHFVNS